ncbi:glutamate receptor ionotropic, NMDA 2C-like [Dermatophagoides pteronyssinus]|uniref:glutamate receptor ionotropic, NMDA 2C-like n=1 Tax=Dermatophagoides pteronyssinus TaxID=6956 RepID=UPI003F66D34A
MQRLNLANHTFRVGVFQYPPYIRLNEHGQVVAGIEGHLLKILENYFNFTSILIRFENYGHKNHNGTWTGMIGEIFANRMDISFSSTAMIYERYVDIDFLYPHWFDRYTYATLPPDELSVNNFDIFIRPFGMKVWFCIGLTFLLFTIFERIKYLMAITANLNRFSNIKSSANHHLVHIGIHLLFNQSYPNINRMNLAKKLIFIIWALCTVVLTNYYCSYLFSMISVPPNMAIDTMDKLVDACQSHQINIFGPDHTFISDSFGKSDDPLMKTMWKCLQLVDKIENYLPIPMAMKNRKNNHKQLAMISSVSRLIYAQIVLGTRSLYLPPLDKDASYFYQLMIALPISQTLRPYRHEFRMIIEYLRGSGLYRYWWEQEIQYAQLLNRNEKIHYDKTVFDGDFSILQINHLENVFLIYIAGISIGLCSIIIEIFIQKRQQSNSVQ